MTTALLVTFAYAACCIYVIDAVMKAPVIEE